MSIDAFCTLATIECIDELALFLVSLRKHHPVTPVYVATTTPLLQRLQDVRNSNIHRNKTASAEREQGEMARLDVLSELYGTDRNIHWVPMLDSYIGNWSLTTSPSTASKLQYTAPVPIQRSAMEATQGVFYRTRHEDFMMEKANIMELAMRKTPPTTTVAVGNKQQQHANNVPFVLFLDCDVCTLAPWQLPIASSDSPSSSLVVASPHLIRTQDERMWGEFNGGCFGTNDPTALFRWKRHTETSRFYDQASIEDVVRDWKSSSSFGSQRRVQQQEALMFPAQVNFGYWRLFQARSLSSSELTRTSAQRGSKNNNDEAQEATMQMNLVKDVELARFTIGQGVLSSATKGVASAKNLILYDGKPLQSVHTHFFVHQTYGMHTQQQQRKATLVGSGDRCMPLFNAIMKSLMKKTPGDAYRHVLKLL